MLALGCPSAIVSDRPHIDIDNRSPVLRRILDEPHCSALNIDLEPDDSIPSVWAKFTIAHAMILLALPDDPFDRGQLVLMPHHVLSLVALTCSYGPSCSW